jgi:hypothetical protein
MYERRRAISSNSFECTALIRRLFVFPLSVLCILEILSDGRFLFFDRCSQENVFVEGSALRSWLG